MSEYPICRIRLPPNESWAYVPLRSTRDGGSRVWQIGFDAVSNEIVTAYGKVGGKIQIARAELVPMGNRDHFQQSVIAVNGKVKVKMCKDGFVPLDKSDSPGRTTAASASKSAERPRPVPMLAHDLNKIKKPLRFPVAVQPKFDGIRCMVDRISDLEGKNDIRLTSRGGNDFDHLKSLFADEVKCVLRHLPEEAVLDGELVVQRKDGCDFQATTSAVRTHLTISETAKNGVKLLVFGLWLPDTPYCPFLERASRLESAFRLAEDTSGRLEKVAMVHHHRCHSMDEVERLHSTFVGSGEEGAMIYAIDGIYEPKRSNNLLKYKTFDEFEGEVVGVEPGKGKEKNAAVVVIKCQNGKIVKMHPEGSISEREKWLADPSLVVGKVMTYKCQGLTKAGVPRHPVAKCIRDYE